MKIKYKITGAFGVRSEGEVINAILLNLDEDSGIGLCFHPPTKSECGSFEFIKKNEHGVWIGAFGDGTYSNVGKLDATFKKFLKDKK